jgi:flagellar motor component MotA
MSVGYTLILIGLILAITMFVISYEYPNATEGGIGAAVAIGSLLIIVTGGLFLHKSNSSRTV